MEKRNQMPDMSRTLQINLLLIFCLVWVPLPLIGQNGTNSPEYTTSPARLYVVTDRMADTLGDGKVVFTNEVDTTGRLKYLLVTYESGFWYAQAFPDLASLLENPAPYRDWTVWVHGDGQSFEISMERASEIQALHEVNLIIFSWPTLQPGSGPIGNFKNSQKNAGLTTPYLHEFFHELDRYRKMPFNRIQAGHLSIFFHSLGCYMLHEALDNGYLQDIPGALFDNMVINAAAVPAEGHAEWVQQIRLQQRIYIAFNDGDINLAGLRVFSGQGYQLGELPASPLAENAIYLDFSVSVGFRFPTGATHSYYYATMTELSQNIKETYSILFMGYPLRFGDAQRFEPTPDEKVVKVLF